MKIELSINNKRSVSHTQNENTHKHTKNPDLTLEVNEGKKSVWCTRAHCHPKAGQEADRAGE